MGVGFFSVLVGCAIFVSMKKFVLTVLAVAIAAVTAEACTSAIVSGKCTADGRPIMWKHRDTSDPNNKIERIDSVGQIPYVALFNSSDTLCREAWMGMNDCGFAIMNTASYNLKNDTITVMDKEGVLMAKALGLCRTVDDFANLLDSLPKPLRVEANFGVIDAYGNAAYFETDNWKYARYDVEEYMVRTNYSKSGREREGYGYVREATAIHLLMPYLESRSVTPAVFTEKLSRSYYHSLIGKDFANDSVEWITDNDFIPRRISSASIAIQGVNSPEEVKDIVMWTVLGYPPCGVVAPVKMDSIPSDLRADDKTGRAPASDKANELKKQVFSFGYDNGKNYISIKSLFNVAGTGISQVCHEQSMAVYAKYGIKLTQR